DVSERRTGGRCRQSGDVDIVLDRDRDAEKRETIVIQAARFSNRLTLFAHRDEHGGVGIRTKPRVRACNSVGRRQAAGAMGGDYGGGGVGGQLDPPPIFPPPRTGGAFFAPKTPFR